MLPLDYSDKELIESIRLLILERKKRTAVTFAEIGGGESRTVRNYVSPTYLSDMESLSSRTVATLNEILGRLDVSKVDIEQFHKQRLDNQTQSRNHPYTEGLDKGILKINSATKNTQVNNENCRQTINFTNNTIGTIVEGNQTVIKGNQTVVEGNQTVIKGDQTIIEGNQKIYKEKQD